MANISFKFEFKTNSFSKEAILFDLIDLQRSSIPFNNLLNAMTSIKTVIFVDSPNTFIGGPAFVYSSAMGLSATYGSTQYIYLNPEKMKIGVNGIQEPITSTIIHEFTHAIPDVYNAGDLDARHTRGLDYENPVRESLGWAKRTLDDITAPPVPRVGDIRYYSYSQSRCFLAGTPILMADGRTKPIEEIRRGDEVASFDPNVQQGLGPLKPGKVTRTFTNITKTIINLRGTHMTPGHVVLMDNGEWDIIARALKDDRAIVEERKGADGSSEATLVRARTGAPLGSLEDTPIKVIFADPATGRDRLALVRAGIPVKGKKLDDSNLKLYTMADILTMQDYTVEPDGTIICKDGLRYEGTPWACDIEPPYHLPMRENWLLALDDETYTPPWILDLPLEQEEVGQMVVNDLQNPKMFVNPTAATLPRPQIGLAASSAAPRPPNRRERHKRAAKLRTVT